MKQGTMDVTLSSPGHVERWIWSVNNVNMDKTIMKKKKKWKKGYEICRYENSGNNRENEKWKLVVA